MTLNNDQFTILQQLFGNADESQKAALVAMMNASAPAEQPVTVSSVEEYLSSKKEVHVCPHCGSEHVVKNGKTKSGRQRFVCRDCKKTIGFSKETILFSTKKDFSVWSMFIQCMVQKLSVRKCARICDISIPTAFAWRHKILDALTNMMNDVVLEGVVQSDETYQLISYKGNHKKSRNFTMPRKAHKHGGKASKRGLSKEQVCITSGIDLGGHSIGKVSNLGKPCKKHLESVLLWKISAGAAFVTDSHRGYCKLAGDMGLTHFRVPRKRHTVEGGFNIQMVNNYHSSFKRMINGLFMGVASKYLNNYVVYHNLVNFAHGSEAHKEAVMRDFVFTTRCVSLWAKNPTRPAIPCAA